MLNPHQDEKQTRDQICDPLEAFRAETMNILKNVLSSLVVDTKVPIVLEPPPPGFGDFAFPCFNLAPIFKKKPADIAHDLKSRLPQRPDLNYEVKGPYLNFSISDIELANSVLTTIFARADGYGELPEHGIKCILEHTSANPNGPFHVGRARNPVLGDTLARILRAGGYKVETQYWVNDMGKQSALMTWGVMNISPSTLPEIERDKPDHDIVRYYQSAAQAIEDDPGLESTIGDMLVNYERGDQELSKVMLENCERVLDGMKQSLARLNINVDRYIYESKFVKDRSVYNIIDKLKSSKYTKEEDGAHYLDLEEFNIHGRTARFVFTRSDGTSLYTTRDLAYHSFKLNNCDLAINILGEDHRLQSKLLGIALNLLGFETVPEVVFYSFVSLPEGKMSTRRRRVVFLDDLMDEAFDRALTEVSRRREDLSEDEKRSIAEHVAMGAIRYNIVRVQAEKKIIFKWEDALNFEGDSAPFAQYAHARACSILRKAENYLPGKFQAELITDPYELALVRILGALPGVVRDCSEKRAAHPLAGYTHELAAAFNQFYRDCQVLNTDTPDLTQTRLTLVDATRIGLKNSLGLLGISALEKM